MSFDDAISATTSALDLSPQPNGGHPAMAADDAPPAAGKPLTATGTFNPLDYPLALATPLRLTQTADWHQHIPFAFALVDMLRPRTFVELGVFRGDSFSAVCQAVDSLGLPTTCVAVDSWAGDIHTGDYGDAVYEDIFTYVRERYASFATLWRMSFDNAVGEVEDGSIDLLHIDGTHTYEAVRHDFDTWLSKLSPRGVVIMHDVNEHQENFGVYRLWDEISQRYPSCAFRYGHGLGVVAAGAEPPQPLLDFLAAMRDNPNVARYFQILGERVLRMSQDHALVQSLEQRLTAQIEAAQAARAAEAARAEQADATMRELRDTIDSLQMQTSIHVGELARLTGENKRLSQERATYDGQVAERDAINKALNAQLYSLRVSRTYRMARLMTWPLRKVKRLARRG